MESIIFTNAYGESVTLGRSHPFILRFLDGSGGAETLVQMQKAPNQDGATYLDTLLEPRSMTFEVIIRADTQTELFEYRRKLARVFNPKLGLGRLVYQYYGGEKEIAAAVELAPVFPSDRDSSGPTFQKSLFTVICPSPFWLDTFTESEEMAAWLGYFKFPLRFPTRMGAQGSVRTLNNIGDVEAPVIIEFNGPAVNPKVVNLTTGEFVRVKRTLAEGDKLTIDTTFGRKRVEINGLNAFNWIDLESTFWQLRPGYNVVEYTADSGQENATVQIKWRNRYSGV